MRVNYHVEVIVTKRDNRLSGSFYRYCRVGGPPKRDGLWGFKFVVVVLGATKWKAKKCQIKIAPV